jgi:hypothetical protein
MLSPLVRYSALAETFTELPYHNGFVHPIFFPSTGQYESRIPANVRLFKNLRPPTRAAVSTAVRVFYFVRLF